MKRPKRAFLIALTGGIAAGKTLACQELEDLGFQVYYSDEIAHKILARKEIRTVLAKKFEKFDLIRKGELDRKLLSDLVFNDPPKLKYLNDLIHPLVREEIKHIIEHSREKVIIFEIPLLVESNMQKAFDLTINLHTEKNLQIERLQKNRKMSREKAEKIINSQIEPVVRIESTDLTIYNTGEISDLRNRIRNLVKKIPKFPFKKVIKITETGI